MTWRIEKLYLHRAVWSPSISCLKQSNKATDHNCIRLTLVAELSQHDTQLYYITPQKLIESFHYQAITWSSHRLYDCMGWRITFQHINIKSGRWHHYDTTVHIQYTRAQSKSVWDARTHSEVRVILTQKPLINILFSFFNHKIYILKNGSLGSTLYTQYFNYTYSFVEASSMTILVRTM